MLFNTLGLLDVKGVSGRADSLVRRSDIVGRARNVYGRVVSVASIYKRFRNYTVHPIGVVDRISMTISNYSPVALRDFVKIKRNFAKFNGILSEFKRIYYYTRRNYIERKMKRTDNR